MTKYFLVTDYIQIFYQIFTILNGKQIIIETRNRNYYIQPNMHTQTKMVFCYERQGAPSPRLRDFFPIQ